MFGGIVRTLSDVCYIPDMKRNLILLSTLDVKGFKYQGGHTLIKVSRGSLTVMKGEVLHFQVMLMLLQVKYLILMLLTFGIYVWGT
jgi:hypothetical protein